MFRNSKTVLIFAAHSSVPRCGILLLQRPLASHTVAAGWTFAVRAWDLISVWKRTLRNLIAVLHEFDDANGYLGRHIPGFKVAQRHKDAIRCSERHHHVTCKGRSLRSTY